MLSSFPTFFSFFPFFLDISLLRYIDILHKICDHFLKSLYKLHHQEWFAMNTRFLTTRYGLILSSYWMGYAAVFAYVSLYMLDLGFTSGQVGLLIAVSGLVSALLQPVLAGYADKPESISLKSLNLLIGGGCALCGGLLPLVRQWPAVTALVYGLALALLQLATPFINALGMTSLNCGSKLNFGVSKSAGAASFAVASWILGKVTSRFGSPVVPVAIAGFFLLFLGFVAIYPKQRAPKTEKARRSVGFGQFVRKYPKFIALLAGCILLYISHVLLNSFTLQIIRTKGGDSEQMGTAMAIAALAELPTMLAFTRLLKKRGSYYWLRFSGFFFVLKTLGSLVCTNVGQYYALQLFQLLAWGMITMASVYYVNSIMDPGDSVKGQAYFTMAYTLASVAGAVLGGRMIDLVGVNTMLVFGTICAAIGTVVVCGFVEKAEDKSV